MRKQHEKVQYHHHLFETDKYNGHRHAPLLFFVIWSDFEHFLRTSCPDWRWSLVQRLFCLDWGYNGLQGCEGRLAPFCSTLTSLILKFHVTTHDTCKNVSVIVVIFKQFVIRVWLQTLTPEPSFRLNSSGKYPAPHKLLQYIYCTYSNGWKFILSSLAWDVISKLCKSHCCNNYTLKRKLMPLRLIAFVRFWYY